MANSFKCKNLYEYLKTLSPATLSTLYLHPATCMAIFRELPEIAKIYIVRLLHIEQPVFQALVKSWVDPKKIHLHNEAAQALTDLRIWVETNTNGPSNLHGWTLSSSFRQSIKTIVMNKNMDWGLLPLSDSDKDIIELDKYATEKWENILHYMVGNNASISQDVSTVLVHAGLMKLDENSTHSHIITKDGFQFVLMDTVSQVWYFIIQYLGTLQERGMDLVECLTFLFKLSILTLGKSYSTENLSENLQNFLRQLKEFGLIFQRKKKSKRFYPTRLAINLAFGVNENGPPVDEPGFLVVETNYHVFAYTDSSLKLALLALFTEINYRFPNVCVGMITRESVRQAFKCGITAQQIVRFLKMHSSSITANKKHAIPPTIEDQIQLWQEERDRFSHKEGVLYSQFLSQNDFLLLEDYARNKGVLIWSNPTNRVMVVSRSGHDDVRRFWKKHRQEH